MSSNPTSTHPARTYTTHQHLHANTHIYVLERDTCACAHPHTHLLALDGFRRQEILSAAFETEVVEEIEDAPVGTLAAMAFVHVQAASCDVIAQEGVELFRVMDLNVREGLVVDGEEGHGLATIFGVH